MMFEEMTGWGLVYYSYVRSLLAVHVENGRRRVGSVDEQSSEREIL